MLHVVMSVKLQFHNMNFLFTLTDSLNCKIEIESLEYLTSTNYTIICIFECTRENIETSHL